MAKILLELPEKDLRQIEAVAEVEDRTRSAQIRKILSDWLKRELAETESGERTGRKKA